MLVRWQPEMSFRKNGIGSMRRVVALAKPRSANQVDSSSTREYGGTGLGLAIVKNFVEAHGGQVWLDTAVEEGATFVVLLPVAPVGDNKGS